MENDTQSASAAAIALHQLQAKMARRERITNLACAMILLHMAVFQDCRTVHLIGSGAAA